MKFDQRNYYSNSETKQVESKYVVLGWKTSIEFLCGF